jgi:predicted transcriptional regulator
VTDIVGRPDFVVVARLLEVLWREGRPLRKTRLQGAALVNYTVFSRYLDFLLGRGLVHLVGESGDELVELTDKGYAAHRFLVEGLDKIFGMSGRR